MRQKNFSEEETSSMMSGISFSFVDNINKARTTVYMHVEPKISYFSGFKICKIGKSYFIEVTNPAKKEWAMAYAKRLVECRIRHYDDDDSSVNALEEQAAREKTQEFYGPEYVEDLDTAQAKSFETGFNGVYIREPFRQLSVDPETIGA